ncbi:MAG: conjugal transfer protein [Acidimicrobiia bacterium]|nr:conjugal transfer protein [Acidimicrobiia bacterium]
MDVDIYHSYTQALRHPVIIGHVAGWRLPWALSASQLGAVAAMSGLLLATRPVWAHLGSVGNLAVFTVAVGGVGWAVRHWRIEGRSPFLVAAGVAVVLFSPGCRRGVRNGTPVAQPRPTPSNRIGTVIRCASVGDRGRTDG